MRNFFLRYNKPQKNPEFSQAFPFP